MTGNYVVNDEGEVIAQVVGTYHPTFYLHELKNKFDTIETTVWDNNYPDWKNKLLLVLWYKKMQRNMTKKEVASIFNLEEDKISDKLYLVLTKEYSSMIVPIDSVKLLDMSEANENENNQQ